MKRFLAITLSVMLFAFVLTSCSLSTSKSSSTTGNIFGAYEGKSNVTINRENYLEKDLDIVPGSGEIYDANYKAAKHRNEIDLAGVDFKMKNGSNECILILNPNGSYKNTYDATGINFIVRSTGESSFLPRDLTPLLKKGTEVITLNTTDKAFKTVITIGRSIYTLDCKFQGKELTGTWNLVSGGKELMKSEFILKLTVEMPNQ
jgi:hypothetical protein